MPSGQPAGWEAKEEGLFRAADNDFMEWATAEAREASKQASRVWSLRDTPLTELGIEELTRVREMLIGEDGEHPHLRIYVAAGGALARPAGGHRFSLPATHPCSFALSSVYGVEMDLLEFVLTAPRIQTLSAATADYVYFPHCATVAYFFLQAPVIRLAEAALGHRSVLTNDTNQAQFLSPILASIDKNLLAGVLARRVSRSPAYKACQARKPRGRCRPLFVNFLGRTWLPEFSRRFPDAVFITHAAESRWLAEGGGQALYHGMARPGGQSPEAASLLDEDWPEEGGSVEEATAQHDVPLPLPVHALWTARSSLWANRDVLACFAGSLNSPVRHALFGIFGDASSSAGDDVGSTYLSRGRWHRARRPRRGVQLHGSVRRLRISEASELMYRSKLCLVPDGDQPNTQRLVEAAAHGCVPLVISSRLLPSFRRLIAWRKCAIFIREEEVNRLPDLLDELERTPQVLEAMHEHLEFLAEALLHGGLRQTFAFQVFLLAELSQRKEEGVVYWQRRQRNGNAPLRGVKAKRRSAPQRGSRVMAAQWFTRGGENSSSPSFWEAFLLPPEDEN